MGDFGSETEWGGVIFRLPETVFLIGEYGMKKIFYPMYISAYCGMTCAQTPLAVPVQPEARFEIAQPEKNQPVTAPQSEPTTSSEVRHIRSQDLLHEPELLQQALDSTMLARDNEAVRLLLPIYLQLNQKDEILAQYAQARLAHADGKITEAIYLYEQILQKQHDAAPVRLDLVQTLLHDHRHKEAKQQLAILTQSENLPDDVAQLLQQYQAYLQQQQKWQFSGSMNYVQENNINNAPSQNRIETETGSWTFPDAEKAYGVSYDFSADKKKPIKGNWSALAGASVYGRHYTKKRDYNDLNVGVHAGVAHKNAKREWRVTPLAEKRWFGGKAYSQQYGVRVQHNRALNPKWHSFTTVRVAYTKHKHRQFLDGSSFSASQTLQYQVNPNNTLLLGADVSRENARDKSSANFRKAARVGWVNRWKGLETSAHLMMSQRKYGGADWFLNERRKDKGYTTNLKLAHNKIAWRGVMPKVVWRWDKQNSNHALYRYRKQQVFVELDKAF